MEKDDPFAPKPSTKNGNNDDGFGTGSANSGGNSGGNSNAGVVGNIGDGGVGASEIGGSGSEIRDFSIGDEERIVVPPRRIRQSRARSGSGRGDSGAGSGSGNSGNSAPDGQGTGAETSTPLVGGDVPRPVSHRSLRGKSSPADVILTGEFVTEIWSLAFSGAALVMRDPEWKVGEEDAAELGKRTVKLLKTLDAKSADKLEKRIAKYAPSLSLLMALGAIVAPRIANTRSKRKNAINLREKETSGRGDTGRTASSGDSGSVANSVADGFNRNGTGDTKGADAIRITPLRRESGSEYFGGDDV